VNLEEILRNILERLEKHKIAYMITGSLASNFYSIPRTTFDLDIIIEPYMEKIEKFLNEIENDFYFDLEAVREAVPEDTILSKLLWAKLGESEKQFKDALLVAKVQKTNIDFDYLITQAKKLGIEDLWEKLLNEIEEED